MQYGRPQSPCAGECVHGHLKGNSRDAHLFWQAPQAEPIVRRDARGVVVDVAVSSENVEGRRAAGGAPASSRQRHDNNEAERDRRREGAGIDADRRFSAERLSARAACTRARASFLRRNAAGFLCIAAECSE